MAHRARIAIVPYNAAWAEMFRSERELLLTRFDPATTLIEHVGSTAIPGLGAKPIIDILLGVCRLSEVESRIPELAGVGYEYLPEHEAAFPERRFFAKPTHRPRVFHLNAVETTSAFWQDHVLFRDFLRGHPEVASEYFRLKVRLAAQYGDDREGYTGAKAEFITAVLGRARHEMRAESGARPTAGVDPPGRCAIAGGGES